MSVYFFLIILYHINQCLSFDASNKLKEAIIIMYKATWLEYTKQVESYILYVLRVINLTVNSTFVRINFVFGHGVFFIRSINPTYIFQTRTTKHVYSFPFNILLVTTHDPSLPPKPLSFTTHLQSQNRFSSTWRRLCCRSNKPGREPTATILALITPPTIIKVIRVAQRVIPETTWFWLFPSLSR